MATAIVTADIGRGRLETRYGTLEVVVRHLGESGIDVLIDGRTAGTCEWEGAGVGNAADAAENFDAWSVVRYVLLGLEMPRRVVLSDLDAQTWALVDEMVGRIVGGV